jgi:hypothetical protein
MKTVARIIVISLAFLGFLATRSAKASSDEMVAHLKARHTFHVEGFGWTAGGECDVPRGACPMVLLGSLDHEGH